MNENSLLFFIRTIWRFAPRLHHLQITYVTLCILSVIVDLLNPLILREAIRTIERGGALETVVTTVLTLLAFYLLTRLLFWTFHGPSRVIEQKLAYAIRQNFQMELFNKLCQLSVKWHKDRHSGKLVELMGKATSSLEGIASETFVIIRICSQIFFSVIMLATLNMGAALSVFIGTVAVYWTVVLLNRRIVKVEETISHDSQHAAEAVHDFITNITTVISLRIQTLCSNEVQKRLSLLQPRIGRNAVLNETKWCLTSQFVRASSVGALVSYALLRYWRNEVLVASEFVILYQYLLHVGDSFYDLTGFQGRMMQSAVRVRLALEILDEGNPIQEDTTVFPEEWQEIEIQNLVFSHNEDGTQTHLDHVAITLRRGKTVAFVGASGAGKSTMAALLRGLLKADSSEVLVDGLRVAEGLEGVGAITSLVPQDPELFANTMRYNVTMGMDATDEEVRECCVLARFEEVIESLPNGVETNIAEKGVNLSGDQKQRLALARGIFFARRARSSLIVLDEPTSSVDPHSERHIYDHLLQAFENCCIVSTLHRLHLLPLFDEVVVFDDGQVVGQGAPADLLRSNATLQRLWSTYAISSAEESDKGKMIA